MIDRASRDALAELARHFQAGRITNRELENSLPSSRDRAIRQIWWNALWGLYDDFHEHRLVGRYYTPRDSRADLARCILFRKRVVVAALTKCPVGLIRANTPRSEHG